HASVHVDRSPRVMLADGSLTPHRGALAQPFAFSIDATNAGDAAVELDPAQTWARVVGGSALHGLAAPATLASASITTVQFGSAALDGPLGDVAVDFHLAGTDNGNPWTSDLRTGTALHIDRAANLEVTAVRPNPARVTSGQVAPYVVRVAVFNH